DHTASASINAGQAEDLDAPTRGLAEVEPGTLSMQALEAALVDGPRRTGLVDPLAVPVAIDAYGRQVADPGEIRQRRDVLAEVAQHHIALEVRRNADQDVRGALQKRAHIVRCLVPAELGELQGAQGDLGRQAHAGAG